VSPVRFAKLVVWANAFAPLGFFLSDAAAGRLGANPVELALRTTGILTLVFLTLTLCVSPARKLLKRPWIGKLRRLIGLFAFFYGTLHMSIYVGLEQGLSLGAVAQDLAGRPFILAGMLGYLLMVPLAVTSTTKWIKRMGGKRWASLHRSVYLVALLGVLHFWLLVKADHTRPLVFALLVGLLLGYRLVTRGK
jgi:DMSO/TMAO reductase YedYZ heme-binding membrane subunit